MTDQQDVNGVPKKLRNGLAFALAALVFIWGFFWADILTFLKEWQGAFVALAGLATASATAALVWITYRLGQLSERLVAVEEGRFLGFDEVLRPHVKGMIDVLDGILPEFRNIFCTAVKRPLFIDKGVVRSLIVRLDVQLRLLGDELKKLSPLLDKAPPPSAVRVQRLQEYLKSTRERIRTAADLIDSGSDQQIAFSLRDTAFDVSLLYQLAADFTGTGDYAGRAYFDEIKDPMAESWEVYKSAASDSGDSPESD